jgi:hypothetical protein
MPKYLGDVRCWGQSGKHLLAVSISGFDPTQTWAHWSVLVLLLAVKAESANCADPYRDAQSQRVGLPGLVAALHSSLPHSIYVGHSLMRINAGSFGEEMVNCLGRISPTSELDRVGTEEAGMWRET